ncbi:hypothetical protein CDD82_1209 [Ophiocordyceps australis]|uniref:Vacuolar aminopeptidase 1 n=1 Tax=Ophiocordyceps australis TaxID=1399860 RepID=A0A2C5ZN43_9HYPO|nr:hypothetical protein CDD82_1209 [Ophiocordyceps australis]
MTYHTVPSSGSSWRYPLIDRDTLNRDSPTPYAASPPYSSPVVLSDVLGSDAPNAEACTSCLSKLQSYERAFFTQRKLDTEPCQLCLLTKCRPEAFTEPFMSFLRNNPTVFHVVEHFRKKLHQAGFQELSERTSWIGKVKPGGKYWTTRNGSSLVAFKVGESYSPGNGFAMVAGHIDALTARLKPVSKLDDKAGYTQLAVAPYAGGLNHTWWDRDLALGGRVVVREESSDHTTTRLFKTDRPVARIPTLAPHFGVGMFGQNNAETQAVPVIGLQDTHAKTKEDALGSPGSFVSLQPPKVVKLVADGLGLKNPNSILDWDLELYDSQPAQTLGIDADFISAGRIDDKLCSWSALTSLIATDDQKFGHVKLVALFDNEEIGSLLRQGAHGNLLPLVVERTTEALASQSSSKSSTYGPGMLGQTYARSFLLSADVTHAGNPNFLEQYLQNHTPKLNVGIVLSTDSNGNMTTDAVSSAVVRRVAELCGAQTQLFQIRNDSRSGGTVGPMLSSAMGVRAADVGLAQLSMHSVRAMTGSLEPGLGVQFFKCFFDKWEQIDSEWA